MTTLRISTNEGILEFPDRLMIRDTLLHDDMDGLGQRIYTTAGQGYKRIEYIRADLIQEETEPFVWFTYVNLPFKGYEPLYSKSKYKPEGKGWIPLYGNPLRFITQLEKEERTC